MELKPVIKVKDLHFGYKKNKVLKGIDFELYKGEVVSLLGPNGCGKSTLMKLMLKLLDAPDVISLDGFSLQEYSHKEIASHIAYIPQYHNVPFNYSVMEMVVMGRISKLGFFATPSSSDYKVAKDALKRAGILELEDRPFGQLSGGQKQLVLLARAIAQEVNVFFMDEPVNGLDYGNQIRLLEIIDSLAREGYTFLKTTHYPDHALLVSSRVVVMDGGVIIENGMPEDVIHSKMISDVYGIKAEIITHDAHKRCVPIFR